MLWGQGLQKDREVGRTSAGTWVPRLVGRERVKQGGARSESPWHREAGTANSCGHYLPNSLCAPSLFCFISFDLHGNRLG